MDETKLYVSRAQRSFPVSDTLHPYMKTSQCQMYTGCGVDGCGVDDPVSIKDARDPFLEFGNCRSGRCSGSEYQSSRIPLEYGSGWKMSNVVRMTYHLLTTSNTYWTIRRNIFVTRNVSTRSNAKFFSQRKIDYLRINALPVSSADLSVIEHDKTKCSSSTERYRTTSGIEESVASAIRHRITSLTRVET